MAATQSRTGRWGNATVNGVVINITKWTAKPRKEFADSTDSGGYDSVTTQVFTSQKPGATGLDGTIEGNYDFGGTTDANFTQLFNSDGPYATVLGFSPTTTFASFNADYSDVEYSVMVPGATMITFTANFKSNGKPTYT
jgi:hypothetical protein